MANIKFSQFSESTDVANVDFVVGYDGATNVRISPTNLVATVGPFLPLTAGSSKKLSGDLYVGDAGPNAIYLKDSGALWLGNSADVLLIHEPTSGKSYLQSRTANVPLVLSGTSTVNLEKYNSGTDGDKGLSYIIDGALELYHNNSKKLETTSTGIAIPSGQSVDFINSNLGYNAIKRNSTVGGLEIRTGDAASINILDNGNVGIGTTSPGYKLEVNGTARITSALTFGGNVNNIIAGTASSLDFKSNGDYFFRKGANTNLTILADGNVGIGTTSPGDKLSIEGSDSVRMSIYSTDTGSQSVPKTFIDLYGENTAAQKRKQASIASAPGHNASNAGELQFFTNDSSQASQQRMTIREDGNVGINTDTPSEKLHVDGNIRVNSGTQGYYGSFLQAISSSGLKVGNDNFSGYAFFNDNGNVGIDTESPDYKFEVQGVISSADAGLQKATFANVGNDLVLTANADATNATAKILFKSSGSGGGAVSTKMIIDGSGNLGIGTTSPGVKLDVDGQIRSDDSFLLNSGATAIGSIRNQAGALDIRGDSTRDVSLGSATSPQALFIEGSNGNVAIGMTSPVAKLQVVGLTEHADNAAAITAGLTAGAFYRTGDLLKVVH